MVAEVSVAALAGDAALAWTRLSRPELALQDCDPAASARYGAELVRRARDTGDVLSHGELQLSVDRVNRTLDRDLERVGAVRTVAGSVARGGAGLAAALSLPALGLPGLRVGREDEVRYQAELAALMEERGGELWHEDIVAAVEAVGQDRKELESWAGVARGLDSAVRAGDWVGLLSYLANNATRLGVEGEVRPERARDYLARLQAEQALQPTVGHSWLRVELPGGPAWVEVEGGRHSWVEPPVRGRPALLSLEAVRDAVAGSCPGPTSPHFLACLVQFQARARGSLVRAGLFNMLDWYYRLVLTLLYDMFRIVL